MAGRPEGGAVPINHDEAAAKSLLAAFGLPVPAGCRAATPDEAATAARDIGFPVALKALGIAHKSELNAVRLNLRDETAVLAAAAELSALGTGLYVERMVEGSVAELIVGITRDPAFGPVMTIGTGGVLVELLKDTSTLLLPATREEIEEALRALKLFPLLDGYRGRPKADVEAAVDAVLGIADFALIHAGSLEELDINPLIVCERGAWIADALMVLCDSGQDRPPSSPSMQGCPGKVIEHRRSSFGWTSGGVLGGSG
jgi:succinyl-CoA synthetase beta subunit